MSYLARKLQIAHPETAHDERPAEGRSGDVWVDL